MSSGRLQMSMLSGLRMSETKAGVMPTGLIMIVSTAPLSTNIFSMKPHCCVSARQLSCETSCDLASWLVCLTVISTCLLEVQVIVCGWNPERSMMKLTVRKQHSSGLYASLKFHCENVQAHVFLLI